MTSTIKPPTDAELRMLLASQDGFHPDPIVFARAVLAKWGHPLAVAGGEPVGYINRGIAPHTAGKVVFHDKPTTNLEARWWSPDEVVYTAPPPQAVREPLTPEQINTAAEIEDNDSAFLAGFHCGARFAEAAHGITKGGQHGDSSP